MSQPRQFSPEKRAHVLKSLISKASLTADVESIRRRPRPALPPLSYAQQRLWFLNQAEPGNPTYNVYSATRLKGELKLPALIQAINEIIRRHEALRTCFPTLDGEPAQRIAESSSATLRQIDLSGFRGEEAEQKLSRIGREDAHYPFDISEGPLLRVTLARKSYEEHIVLLTMHHIVSDGWSMGVANGELERLYTFFAAGGPSPLPDLAVQYVDYAIWQREYLQDGILGRQLSYWKKQLQGADFVLNLPLERPRPPMKAYRGASRSLSLPAALALRLRELGHSCGATIFMTLLAGFQTLLARYSNQDDVLVGIPIAGRARKETEPLIGFFINMLVMRGDLSRAPSFLELLGRVRETALAAYAHQDLPFEKLVEELQPQRDLSRSPLFQVTFQVQNIPVESKGLRLPKLQLQRYGRDGATAQFDLSLTMIEGAETLGGTIVYDLELFDDSAIGRLLSRFENLLAGIVADPSRSVWEAPILSEFERSQLLVEFNDTKAERPDDRCVHRLFEKKASESPDAISLAFGQGDHLSYFELNARANRLAHLLIDRGVGMESRVGVMMERSAEMVIALLGALKSGGAYLPLDPSYPAPRLSFMMKDADIHLLLTQRRLRDTLDGQVVEAISLDAEWETMAGMPERDTVCSVDADNLAYVIYTSGSTGQPKGVMVEHRGVVNLLYSMREIVAAGPDDCVLALTTLAFDIAGLELYLPLVCGARVALAGATERHDPAALAETIERSGATIVQATPATWRMLLDAGWEGRRGLKALCGGEALPVELAQRIRERVGQVWNVYGPTETTIWSSAAEVGARTLGEGGAPESIGRPIANTQIYLLDRNLHPSPIGIPGDLYIGGSGVARGYINHPEMTADQFIANPFVGDPTAAPSPRIYRTGDVGRYLPDGKLEFLGRNDHQVKIRGFRIELGEIEERLNRHPAVREAVAVAMDDASGGKRLVAYYTLVANEARVDANELRTHLSAALPEYMTPAAWVKLDSMPLTANGKVDRKALPAPVIEEAGEEDARTAVEEIIAGIWAEVLKLERVGIRSNFFELGGHSLLATRVISRVRGALGVEVELRAMFENPTVAGLAMAVEKARGLGVKRGPVQPAPREATIPLSPTQRRMWFLNRLEPTYTGYNLQTSLRVKGERITPALEQVVNEIVRRHRILRTSFPVLNGEPTQQIGEVQPVSIPLVDLSGLNFEKGEQIGRRLVFEHQRRLFNLTRDPVWRGGLLRLSGGEQIVMWTIHHIAIDAWSMGVLNRELGELYGAWVRGESSPLEEPRVQYGDYVVWQRNWFEGEERERQISFWRQRLGEELPVLDLPTDRPRPALQQYLGASESLALSSELTQSLKRLSRWQGATSYMTLLAAFNALLSRYSGQKEIIVGTPIAGRAHAGTENLVGCLLNTLALRADLRGNPSFLELLGRVREVCLGAYAHQDTPFELLLEELHPPRDLSRSPIFQVCFNFMNFEGEILRRQIDYETPTNGQPSGRLIGVELDEDAEWAQFDLTLYAIEIGGQARFKLVYNRALFDRDTIRQMLRHYEEILRNVASQPDRRLSTIELSLPSSGEEPGRRMPAEARPADWEEFVVGEGTSCLVARFVRQAKRFAQRPAIRSRNSSWSYEELNRRADQVARALLRRKPEATRAARVGVLLEHDAPLIAALLGALKAGWSYVPLDARYPKARLAYMLADAEVDLVLISESQRPLMEELRAESVVKWDVMSYEVVANEEAQGDFEVEVNNDELAYLLYTSGSTGQPKAVMQSRKNVLEHIRVYSNALGIGPGDRLSWITSVSFDAAVMDIYGALLNGAQLCVRDIREEGWDGIESWLKQEGVTIYHSTPTVFRYMAANLSNQGPIAGMRVVVLGGEEVERSDVELCKKHFGAKCVLVNGLGPTESTLALQYFVQEGWRSEKRRVPVGYAVEGTEVKLVDEEGHEVRGYGTGELTIKSPQVALGYWKNTEQTATAFAESGDGRREYRTGDWVRRLLDGSLEYLGRRDQQVKIRGQRVELGEIEWHLKQHERVSEAVVEPARDEETGEVQLVAYLVEKGGSRELSEDGVRRFLRERALEAQLPSRIMILREMPLTASGKLDRLRLRKEATAVRSEAAWEEPQPGLEADLATIFREILKRERIGRKENFFDLGGHSLLAARVISQIRTTFGVELPIRDFFTSPTVKAVSERIEEALLEKISPERISQLLDLQEGRI
jgi:amino acid adenylation domain-containing protein